MHYSRFHTFAKSNDCTDFGVDIVNAIQSSPENFHRCDLSRVKAPRELNSRDAEYFRWECLHRSPGKSVQQVDWAVMGGGG